MTPAPEPLGPEASVAEAERVMRAHGCRHVPVVEDGRIVGMLGVRGLIKALVPAGEDDGLRGHEALSARRVGDVMQRDVVALPHTATLLEAARALAARGTDALPVTAPGNVLAGIVTSADLAEAFVDDMSPAASAAPGAGGPERRRHEVAQFRDGQWARLCAVYKAALRYLESGRTEPEHARLRQAVDRAREAVRPSEVEL